MSWSVDNVMPVRDGPENLRILKESQLKVDSGPWRQTFEFSAIGAWSRVVGVSAIESKS